MKSVLLTTWARVVALVCLLIVVPSALWAQNEGPLRGCRRGVLMAKAGRRAPASKQALNGDVYRGERRQLTVLVSYADRGFKDGVEAATMEQWNKIFNVENYNDDGFTGSVRDYFRDQSFGQFNVSFDLYYVALADNMKKYRSTEDDDENSQFLVRDVVDSLLKRDIDWSLYDWNGDGYVNHLLIIYAGKGSSYGGFGGGKDAIWPHQYFMTWHTNPETGEPCEPISFSFNGKDYAVNNYCAVQELYGNVGYGAFGTICHEYTHCFGIPDFYGTSSYLSNWELMDSGNYGGNGFCPCGYSAHERWLMGWLTPQELTAKTSITQMASLSDNQPTAYLIRNEGYSDEYYIVENRQQTKWDTSLPASGVLIFHIDYDPFLWSEGTPNSSEGMHYSIFAANNRRSTSSCRGWAYPYESEELSNNQLTNTSKPAATLLHKNSDGTLLMSKPITNISVVDGMASFDFMDDTATPIRELSTAADEEAGTWYTLDGRKLSSRPSAKGVYICNGRKNLR